MFARLSVARHNQARSSSRLPIFLGPSFVLVMRVLERNLVQIANQWQCGRARWVILGPTTYVP